MGGFYLLVANRKHEPRGRERKTRVRANTDNTPNQGQIFPFVFKLFFILDFKKSPSTKGVPTN